jgi:hypothetical protein
MITLYLTLPAETAKVSMRHSYKNGQSDSVIKLFMACRQNLSTLTLVHEWKQINEIFGTGRS